MTARDRQLLKDLTWLFGRAFAVTLTEAIIDHEGLAPQRKGGGK